MKIQQKKAGSINIIIPIPQLSFDRISHINKQKKNVKPYHNLNATLFLINNDVYNRQPWLYICQFRYVIPPIR